MKDKNCFCPRTSLAMLFAHSIGVATSIGCNHPTFVSEDGFDGISARTGPGTSLAWGHFHQWPLLELGKVFEETTYPLGRLL